jgi:hypothetical protein
MMNVSQYKLLEYTNGTPKKERVNVYREESLGQVKKCVPSPSLRTMSIQIHPYKSMATTATVRRPVKPPVTLTAPLPGVGAPDSVEAPATPVSSGAGAGTLPEGIEPRDVGTVPGRVGLVGKPPVGGVVAPAPPAVVLVEEGGAPPAGGAPPLAVARKASNDFSGVALIAKTIPAAQWFAGAVWPQKNQRGAVALVIVIFHCGGGAPFNPAAGIAWKPESTPKFGVVWRSQGFAKVDWTTEWFLAKKEKVTVSPSFTVMLFGVKTSPPWPRVTAWSVWAQTEATVERAATAREKRILNGEQQKKAVEISKKMDVR